MDQAGTPNPVVYSTDEEVRMHVLEIVRTWLGTPYRHQACMKGAGVDCIGLIRGVGEELYGKLPDGFKMPAYSRSWTEESGTESMVRIALKYLTPVPLGQQLPGHILMYRMLRNGPTKHAGIMSSDTQLIHAYSGHEVAETDLINNWGSKLTHVFAYPLTLG